MIFCLFIHPIAEVVFYAWKALVIGQLLFAHWHTSVVFFSWVPLDNFLKQKLTPSDPREALSSIEVVCRCCMCRGGSSLFGALGEQLHWCPAPIWLHCDCAFNVSINLMFIKWKVYDTTTNQPINGHPPKQWNGSTWFGILFFSRSEYIL